MDLTLHPHPLFWDHVSALNLFVLSQHRQYNYPEKMRVYEPNMWVRNGLCLIDYFVCKLGGESKGVSLPPWETLSLTDGGAACRVMQRHLLLV